MKENKNIFDQKFDQISFMEKRWHSAMDDIAARISSLMEQQELTQDAVATRMGKHKSYISRVLSGGVNLTIKTIAEFEEALGSPLMQIVVEEQVKPIRRRKKPELAGIDNAVSVNAGNEYLIKLPKSIGQSLSNLSQAEGTDPNVLAAVFVASGIQQLESTPFSLYNSFMMGNVLHNLTKLHGAVQTISLQPRSSLVEFSFSAGETGSSSSESEGVQELFSQKLPLYSVMGG